MLVPTNQIEAVPKLGEWFGGHFGTITNGPSRLIKSLMEYDELPGDRSVRSIVRAEALQYSNHENFHESRMSVYLIAGLLTLLPISAALVLLYRTLASRPDLSLSMDQLLTPTPGRYRPMERLLREDDFVFLAKQPGFTPGLGRRLRAERRIIFRGYLRNLRMDFTRATTACHLLIVHSAEDRADLASALMRQKVMFGLGILAVEGRLMLHAAGLGPVDARGLVESLETMQAQMRMLLTPPQAVAANF